MSEHGIEVDKAKIEVIEQLPPPTNVTSLLAKDAPFIFNNECHEAFQILKKAFISALIIQPPDWKLPFEIMYDACDFAVGVVLGQTKDKKHYAISYASKTLSRPQLNYATTEKSCWLLSL
jgi:hypothetical protein